MSSYIKLYNRENKKLETEKVPAVKIMQFMYKNKLGKKLTDKIFNQKAFSVFYGNFLKTKISRNKIDSFIKEYDVNINEAKKSLKEFKTFNDFFIRKLKPEYRPINLNEKAFISPADSRLIIYKISKDIIIPVKGCQFSLSDLLKSEELVQKYLDGYCAIFRLAPVDYHRYCYIDNCNQSEIKKLGNKYDSVNPIALESEKNIFAGNYREYCELKTENFGNLIYMEVGAMGVSKIISKYPYKRPCKKGEEKGYFEFGGSTVIILTEKDKLNFDQDIVEYSKKGIETRVKYGEQIGIKK